MANLWIQIGWLSIWSSGLIWAYYALALSGNRRHTLNRVLLLSGAILPFVLWLVKSNLSVEVSASIPTITLPEITISENGETALFVPWLLLILAMGMMLRIVITSAVIYKMARFVGCSKHYKKDGATWVLVSSQVQVCSFFRYIFWHEDENMTPEMRTQLRAHELCHVRQGHSWDILLLEILIALFWFNPFLWLIRKEIKALHEYLADEAALKAGTPESYQQLMLHWVFPGKTPAIANPFITSTLKKRIKMMKKMQNPLGGMLRYALLLPVFALILGGTMIKAQAKAADPAPNELAKTDKDPVITNLKEIVEKIGYPAEAKAAGLEGKEIVKITFDENGKYKDHTWLKTTSDIFTKAIEAHIAELTSTPAMVNGKPVSVSLTLPFQFKL